MTVTGIAVLAICTAGWSSAAASQDCTASVPQMPQGWVTLSPHVANNMFLLKPVLTLKCSDCAPELWAEVGTGVAAASMRKQPSGAAWALKGATSPKARAGLLAGMLHTLRARAPECTVEAEIEGITTANAQSFVTIGNRQKCLPAGTEAGGLNFAGFDGRCLHDLTVVWKSSASLTPQSRARVHDLLSSIKFGP